VRENRQTALNGHGLVKRSPLYKEAGLGESLALFFEVMTRKTEAIIENIREKMSFIQLPEPNPDILKRRAQIARDLAKIAPYAVFIEDEEGRQVYETDAFTAYRQTPLLVILPSSTIEVSALLTYCYRENIQIVARGAGTSLCGAAVPTTDSIVIGLSRMRRILAVDYENRTARVECGVTNLGISDAVNEHDFFYAPDPSSQIACTIGGNIAMNSGGTHCLKYGVTSNHVMGVKIVMMDGEVVDIGSDALDSPGYDFLGLINGSEGQLGIVTEATVRILRKPEMALPMLIGFNRVKDASDCVAAILTSGMVPTALEFMDRRAIHICENYAKAGYPLDVEALLIIEAEGSEHEINLQFEHVRDVAAKFTPRTIRVAQNNEEADKIWQGRNGVFGAMGHLSDYYCMDGVIPISRLADVLGWVEHICDHYHFEVANVFHAGDGNLHPLILYNANDEDEVLRAEECAAELLRLCIKAGGCLTGEHGVGIGKRDLMRDQFSEVDLVQQTRIKTVFDPKWLLNPAKVFPLDAPGRGGIEANLAELSTPDRESEQ
jgi:glycolate dehydrogenase FAD-linked subunit